MEEAVRRKVAPGTSRRGLSIGLLAGGLVPDQSE
jgi:hypothetical protein